MFEDSGRWDEGYRFGGEDIDLSTQVGRRSELVYVGDVEIVHYGRVSSRANMGSSAPNVAIGYVHYFRKAGARPAALLVYKLLVTADAPVQIVGNLRGACGWPAAGRRSRRKVGWPPAGYGTS